MPIQSKDEFEKLKKIVRGNASYDTVLREDLDPTIFYHLSEKRSTVIRWMNLKDKKILEVGAECGAITDYLLQEAKSVTAIDEDKDSCEINVLRHESDVKSGKLSVLTGDVNLVPKEERFDFILVGPTQVGRFIDDKELRFLLSLLDEKGRLAILASGKYGLKYFAGAKGENQEDLETLLSDKNRVTGKELKALFENHGKDTCLYYPYPDLFFAGSIFSEKRLPRKGEIVGPAVEYKNDRYVYFDEAKAMEHVVEDGLMDVFANAFLLLVEPKNDDKDQVVFAKFNMNRKKNYQLETDVVRSSEDNLYAVKKCISESQRFLSQFTSKKEKIEKLYPDMTPANVEVSSGEARFEFVQGDSPIKEVKVLLEQQASMDEIKVAVENAMKPMVTFSKDSRCTFESSVDFETLFGTTALPLLSEQAEGVRGANLDAIFSNVIVRDGHFTNIDYEWVVDMVMPVDFLKFRILYYFYQETPELKLREDLDSFMKRFGYTKDLVREFLVSESNFQTFVTGNETDVHLKNYIHLKDFPSPERVMELNKGIWERDEIIKKLQEDIAEYKKAMVSPIAHVRLLNKKMKSKRANKKNGK